jgi:hypothetical protein
MNDQHTIKNYKYRLIGKNPSIKYHEFDERNIIINIS